MSPLALQNHILVCSFSTTLLGTGHYILRRSSQVRIELGFFDQASPFEDVPARMFFPGGSKLQLECSLAPKILVQSIDIIDSTSTWRIREPTRVATTESINCGLEFASGLLPTCAAPRWVKCPGRVLIHNFECLCHLQSVSRTTRGLSIGRNLLPDAQSL